MSDQNLDQCELKTVQSAMKIENAHFDTIYSIRILYLFHKEEKFVFIPYVYGDIKDVPTAGGVPWSYTVGVVAMLWRGDRQIYLKTVEIEDAKVSIKADENTVIRYEGMESSYVREIQSQFRFSEDNCSAFVERIDYAITKDSTATPNLTCNCDILWEGKCVVPYSSLLAPVAIDFNVVDNYVYMNNVG